MERLRDVATAVVALAVVAWAAPATADGDPEKGERVYRKCKACHQVGEGAENRVGPVLNGIVGAPAASVPDFGYSGAMEAKRDEGLVWTEEALAAYLVKPRDFVPGTKMTFAGLRKEDDREDVIAYLKTFE